MSITFSNELKLKDMEDSKKYYISIDNGFCNGYRIIRVDDNFYVNPFWLNDKSELSFHHENEESQTMIVKKEFWNVILQYFIFEYPFLKELPYDKFEELDLEAFTTFGVLEGYNLTADNDFKMPSNYLGTFVVKDEHHRVLW